MKEKSTLLFQHICSKGAYSQSDVDTVINVFYKIPPLKMLSNQQYLLISPPFLSDHTGYELLFRFIQIACLGLFGNLKAVTPLSEIQTQLLQITIYEICSVLS